MFWEKMKPIKEKGRRAMGFPRWMSETEYLYGELIKYLEKHPELRARLLGVIRKHTHASVFLTKRRRVVAAAAYNLRNS
jgi:hypothetical protein